MTHHLDHNARLCATHCDQPDPIGYEDGDTCGRFEPPDEDQPKGYRPKPCEGTMHEVRSRDALWAWQECDTCGEIGD